MRFSILLPTRNRLDLLRHAVETVLRQDYSDWEVIVSDNCSEDDVEGYVASLNESRVKYFRTDRIVPVTENWNNALANSSGEYFLMLGDDDGLLDGYFAELERVLDRFDDPDIVYSRTLQFAHPDVLPDHPRGYLALGGMADFFRGRNEPYVLDGRDAVRLVRSSMRFELAFDFNMQFATIRRALVSGLGDARTFFRSAFPDYYAMNLLFLRARRIVVHPRPLTIVGISPKSYGFYRANARIAEGMMMLSGVDGPSLPGGIALPGDDIKAGWVDAAEELERVTGGGLRVDKRRLHAMRALDALVAYRRGALPRADAERFLHLLSLRVRIPLALRVASFFLLSRPLSMRGRTWLMAKMFRHAPFFEPSMIDASYATVVEVFDAERTQSVRLPWP